MINMQQPIERWTFHIKFPDIELPLSAVRVKELPTLQIQEEETEDGAWQARIELSKWLPIKVVFKQPTHRDLLTLLFELWGSRVAESVWSDDPALRGKGLLQKWDGYGKCLEAWTLTNAWISGLEEVTNKRRNICLEISYDSAMAVNNLKRG